jgi:hypothetical protein
MGHAADRVQFLLQTRSRGAVTVRDLRGCLIGPDSDYFGIPARQDVPCAADTSFVALCAHTDFRCTWYRRGPERTQARDPAPASVQPVTWNHAPALPRARARRSECLPEHRRGLLRVAMCQLDGGLIRELVWAVCSCSRSVQAVSVLSLRIGECSRVFGSRNRQNAKVLSPKGFPALFATMSQMTRAGRQALANAPDVLQNTHRTHL